MKKFLFALCAFALALPSVAADNNNIKMVTYFPVPYASYGDLGVTGTCDVGLMEQCALDAGEGLKVAKASSDSRALNTGSIIVRKGTLGLTPQTSVALGTQLTAGSGTGTGVLEFSHDLAVTSINSSRLAKAQAMNEAQMTSLNMYGHPFPKCEEAGNEISWKNLTIGNKSGVFLTCGAPEKLCTMGEWVGVEKMGTSTCNGQHIDGCVEYATCSEAGMPCGGLKEQSSTESISVPCNTGTYVYNRTGMWCLDNYSAPKGENCGPNTSSVKANCPSGDICSSLGDGGSCISRVVSSSGCKGYSTSAGKEEDYGAGGRCTEYFYTCKSGTGTAKVEKITCVSSGYKYYKRTCQ